MERLHLLPSSLRLLLPMIEGAGNFQISTEWKYQLELIHLIKHTESIWVASLLVPLGCGFSSGGLSLFLPTSFTPGQAIATLHVRPVAIEYQPKPHIITNELSNPRQARKKRLTPDNTKIAV